MKLTNKQKIHTYGKHLKVFKIPVVQKIVKEIIENTPTIYFGSSTSSTGKYHPLATNGLSGLVKHSTAVMLIAKDMLENETITKVFNMSNLSDLDKETVLAAALLHDNAKYGAEEKDGDEKYYTLGEHPRLVKDIAIKAKLHETLDEEGLKVLNKMLKMIETHMGQWTNVRGGAPLDKPSTHAQAFIHMCDYIVSRKTFDNVQDIKLPDDTNPDLIKWFETQL